MATNITSSKRLQIDKANATVVVVTAVSSFVVVFSLVASNALLSQRSYQSRVINKKEQARDQLKKNIDTVKSLKNSYSVFVGSTQNVLGGNPKGQGDKDGNNAQIVLDALPSSYDFPAIATSLEKLLSVNGLNTQSISGTDDELTQSNASTSATPQAVTIPFTVSVAGQYDAIQNIVKVFESSIRPISVNSVNISGNDKSLTVSFQAQTYYQPATGLSIKTEDVK